MDVWVVAAAAGAGFVVQRLKNLNVVRPEVSTSRQEAQENSCPLRGVLWRKKFKNEVPKEREKPNEDMLLSTPASESECNVMPDNLRSFSSVPDTISLSGFLSHEGFEGDWDDRVPSDTDFEIVLASDSLHQHSSRESGVSHVFRRNSSSIRSRRRNLRSLEPQTSLESRVMAQLYQEWGEAEESTYSHHRLHKPIVRPFVVSDGRRIISRNPIEPFSPQTETGKHKLLNDAYMTENMAVLGIPELPYVVIGESKQKAKARKGKEPVSRRNGSRENGNNLPRDGPRDNARHFCSGLTMGIISSFLANKQEMDKLNKLLKQSDHLVQDLQDELEMKDSLTVKELAAENYESHDVHNQSCYSDYPINTSLSNEREPDNSVASPHQTNEEESLSRIEAELEAELERLESNMNASRLEGKLSIAAELNPSFVPDIAKGELRGDLFGENSGKQTYADRDGSGTATPHSLPHPVSPRELSLRLHEVIQSRLEERIKELELALEDSQRKLKNVEPSSSSAHGSPPITEDGQCHLDEPVVINLSGEALSAYNEAFEELTKVSESDDEDVRLEGDEDFLHRLHLNDVVVSSSMEERDDEMEMLLIRQIVEKAKQGSRAVLKAQRAFLY